MKRTTCPDCGHPMICPKCKGRVGGRAGGLKTGPTKARSSEAARAAVNARWDKVRKAKAHATSSGRS